MGDNIIKRGLQESIDNYPISNGKIFFSTDSGRLFMDTENERIEYTDFVYGLNYNEIVNLVSPLKKIYLSLDTHQMLAYDFVNHEWNSYSAGATDPQIIVQMQEQINSLTETIEQLNSRLEEYEEIIRIYRAEPEG